MSGVMIYAIMTVVMVSIAMVLYKNVTKHDKTTYSACTARFLPTSSARGSWGSNALHELHITHSQQSGVAGMFVPATLCGLAVRRVLPVGVRRPDQADCTECKAIFAILTTTAPRNPQIPMGLTPNSPNNHNVVWRIPSGPEQKPVR